jgi:AraC-like DNA-binding protein
MLLSLLIQNHSLIERKEEDAGSKNCRNTVIRNVLRYISDNYSNKIYIDDLAGIANMSKCHFCRFFKKYTGMSPVAYLNFFKVNEASKLLLSGNYSVTEAALQTGYDNLSYFAKTFKQYKGVSPSELLK